VKEGSGNWHFSPKGAHWGNLEGGQDHLLWKTVKERSVNRASLSMEVMEKWRESFFIGISARYVRHVKEGFGNEPSLSL
jgi:hypothetical protein